MLDDRAGGLAVIARPAPLLDLTRRRFNRETRAQWGLDQASGPPRPAWAGVGACATKVPSGSTALARCSRHGLTVTGLFPGRPVRASRPGGVGVERQPAGDRPGGRALRPIACVMSSVRPARRSRTRRRGSSGVRGLAGSAWGEGRRAFADPSRHPIVRRRRCCVNAPPRRSDHLRRAGTASAWPSTLSRGGISACSKYAGPQGPLLASTCDWLRPATFCSTARMMGDRVDPRPRGLRARRSDGLCARWRYFWRNLVIKSRRRGRRHLAPNGFCPC